MTLKNLGLSKSHTSQSHEALNAQKGQKSLSEGSSYIIFQH